MRVWGLVLLIGLSGLVSACESVARGTRQDVAIETVPAGAEVRLSDGQRCTSPCRLTLDRYRKLTASISRPDCRSASGQLVPTVTGDATLYGSVFDFQLGGAYDLEPNPLKVTLVCGEEARQNPPGLTPEYLTLLETLGQPVRTIGIGSFVPGSQGMGSSTDVPPGGLRRARGPAGAVPPGFMP